MGRYLLPRLAAAGHTVDAISRRPPEAATPAVRWHRIDITREPEAIPGTPTAIHLAPLWHAPALVDALAARGLRRLIAFGSTSRFTKARSADAAERDLARRLTEAEDALRAACERHGIAWTVFRPTMIYGGGQDKNLSAIARWGRRLGFVMIAGSGRGLRQPVHADDLAAACVTALGTSATHGRAYDLGGGSVLTYREMAQAVCRAAGGARVIGIPSVVLRSAFRIASVLRPYPPVTASMVDRMDQDLTVDHGPAQRDFGYQARAFAYPDGAGLAGAPAR